MPKKMFEYKNFNGSRDIWYTDSLKGWFIVKEKEDQYVLRKGCVVGNTIEFGMNKYNTYKRLGDAKTGLENRLKEKSRSIYEQQILFNRLKEEYEKQKKNEKQIDYAELDKEAERLKAKWGLK